MHHLRDSGNSGKKGQRKWNEAHCQIKNKKVISQCWNLHLETALNSWQSE